MADSRVLLSSSNREYSNIQDGLAACGARSGETIKLLEDLTIGHQLVINKKCTIDLDGHFIFVPITGGLLIKDGVEVTFTNGKIQTLSSDAIEDAIIVQGVRTTLILTDTLEVATHGTAINVRRRGNLVVDGGSVKSTSKQPTICVDASGSTLTMNSGVIASYEKSAIVVRNGGVATINDGRVYTECDGLIPEDCPPAILVNGPDSKITITGGTVSSQNTKTITAQAGAEIEISGGTVYNQNENYTAIELENGNTSFKMTGGWVYSTLNSVILSNKMDIGGVQNIVVTEGKLGAKGDVLMTPGMGDHNILFDGGVFVKGRLPQDYIAAGYVLSDVKDEDGYAEIILKTWVQETPDEDRPLDPDIIPEFGEDDSNPFSSLIPPDPDEFVGIPYADQIPPYLPQDPDLDQPIPFPPEDIAGNTRFINANPENAYIVDAEIRLPDEPDKNLVPDVDPEDDGSKTTPDSETSTDPVNPNTDDTTSDDEIRVLLKSINVRNKIYIYRTPSRKFTIAEWRGALNIYSGSYYSSTGEEFVLVTFRIPGSGRVSTGYVPAKDVSDL